MFWGAIAKGYKSTLYYLIENDDSYIIAMIL